MSEKNASLLPVNENVNEIEKKQTFNDYKNKYNETKETKITQEIDKISNNTSISVSELSDKVNNIELKNGDAGNIEEPTAQDSLMKKSEIIKFIEETGELNEVQIRDKIKCIPEDELLEIIKETDKMNNYLQKENDIYKFILHENENLQSFLDTTEPEEDTTVHESFGMTYSAKCHFAKKKLEQSEKELMKKKNECEQERQNLNFELESINLSIKDLQESKDKFDKNIRLGGRHPVTKKVILEKVVKHFDDSIQRKLALANRYRVQIQSDIKERGKILNQIKAQEQQLASLDTTEFEEAQFEHTKSCRQLAAYKEQLGKFKTKLSPLLQSVAEMEKELEKRQNEMEQMKNAMTKLEHLKQVMQSEKARNEEKVLELKAAMRQIKLDPRRNDLPEIINYAAAKRENAILKKELNRWEKKVEAIQQRSSNSKKSKF